MTLMMRIGPDDYATCVDCGCEMRSPSDGCLLMTGAAAQVFVPICNRCMMKAAQREVRKWHDKAFKVNEEASE